MFLIDTNSHEKPHKKSYREIWLFYDLKRGVENS